MASEYVNFIEQIVGKGIGFENLFSSATGKTVVYSGEEKINNSIKAILSTRIGERFLMPEFGSRLHLVVFEPNDMIAKDLIDIYIREALERWEKRIEVTNIDVGYINHENIVPVSIYYKYRNTNIEYCYVYPYNVGEDGKETLYQQGEYSV